MDIIEQRHQERLKKIGQMQKSIKDATEPDHKKLIMMVCAEWGISKRTAKEYLEVALFNIKNEV